MPTPIERQEVQRLLAVEQAQLVEVLPAAEYEDEHLPGAINIPLKSSTVRRRACSTTVGRCSPTATTTSET
jgi:3-mercaptopyruvate sulfurtransferase SseA